MKTTLILIVLTVFFNCVSTKKTIETPTKKSSKFENIAESSVVKVAIKEPQKKDLEIEIEKVAQAEVEKRNEAEPINELSTPFEAFNHSIWASLLKNNVSVNGNLNYKGFKNEYKKLNAYIEALTTNRPTAQWSKQDKLAYWINAYNALTVDLILRNYPIKSIKDIKNPWDQRLWKFGDKWLNLNHIEHNIIRKMDEPRIHFAIVCAAVSCPKLQNKPFYASNLETQLTDATKAFLTDSSKNNITKNSIMLSKIFKWFAKDFKQNGHLIKFLNSYSEIEISNTAKKNYKAYNWDLNN